MTEKLQYAKAAKISLKERPDFDENWLRDIIASDPSILGLGDLVLKETERMQPKAGRLDLLLQDPDADKRYEVEIMLGRVDESHIIRCLEYWDIERKQLRSFDHCAVLVAEEVTARFLNVISLFSSAIPIIALQLNAIEIDGKVLLNFTRVLDEVTPMTEEEEEELSEKEVTDRTYWKEKGSDLSLSLADQCLEILRELDPSLAFTYTKHYIGLRQGNRANNFIVFKAKKAFLRLELKASELESIREELDKSDLEVLSVSKRRNRVRFVLHRGEVDAQRALLKTLFEKSYKESLE